MRIYGFVLLFSALLIASANGLSSKHIADIPEASGICFSKERNTLFVVNDEGRVYELALNGKVLREKKIGKFDLEGAACDDERGKLYLAVEKRDDVFVVSYKGLKIKQKIDIKREYQGKTLLKKDKKRGLEGIAFDDKHIYLANQSNKAYPKADSSVIVTIRKALQKNQKKAAIQGVVVPKMKDLSGLTFKDEKLYILSDKQDKLVSYDVATSAKLKTYKLPKGAHEGVTFDNKGNCYIADDNGKVVRYPHLKQE